MPAYGKRYLIRRLKVKGHFYNSTVNNVCASTEMFDYEETENFYADI